MIYRLIICTLLLPCLISFQSELKNTDCNFKVKQVALPGPNPIYEYIYENGQLTIMEQKPIFKKDGLKYREKRIYKNRLNDMQINFVDSLVKNAEINKLLPYYNGGWIDGIYWEFKFYKEDYRKEITLNNYCLRRLRKIIDYLNSIIPEKKNVISLDYYKCK